MLNVKAIAVATVLGWAAITANQIAHMLNLDAEQGEVGR
jgi:hypothetical protein